MNALLGQPMVWAGVAAALVVVIASIFLLRKAPAAPPPPSAARAKVRERRAREAGRPAQPRVARKSFAEDDVDVTQMAQVPSLAREDEDKEKEVFVDDEPEVEEQDDAIEATGPHALVLLNAVARTDAGRKRKNNEDSYLVLADRSLFVVADGMGGYAGGEVASKIAVDTVAKCFTDRAFPGYRRRTPHKRANELIAAIHLANRNILAQAKANPELADMGTTIAAARFSASSQSAYVASVGDSRVYRIRDSAIEQLTKDHTLAVEAGVEGAMGAKLSRALGVSAKLRVDLITTGAQIGDCFIICSDGLTKMVPDARIAEVVSANGELQAAANALIAEANAKGGRDNITVIVVRVARLDAQSLRAR